MADTRFEYRNTTGSWRVIISPELVATTLFGIQLLLCDPVKFSLKVAFWNTWCDFELYDDIDRIKRMIDCHLI
jgi:hypothetical protein